MQNANMFPIARHKRLVALADHNRSERLHFDARLRSALRAVRDATMHLMGGALVPFHALGQTPMARVKMPN
jgi:hypothetical protein